MKQYQKGWKNLDYWRIQYTNVLTSVTTFFLILCLNGCSSCEQSTQSGGYGQYGGWKGSVSPPTKQVQPPIIESDPIQFYRTAIYYADEYDVNKNEQTANVAIENFERYYLAAPDGKMSCLALLRKARLLYQTGKYHAYDIEMRRIKSRLDFMKDYPVEIQAIDNLKK
jgi:hypothetical protein